jgi:hypothetical protein
MTGMNPNERAIITVPAYEDLIDRVARFDSFVVAGNRYTSDMLLPQLTIDSKDLVSEAGTCAAFVLFWGTEAARARRFYAQVDASYRMWRDRTFLELKAQPVGQTTTGSDKFPTDVQAEKLYRTQPEYGDWQQRRADAQESAEMAESVYEAFKIKGEMIKAQERIMRDEAGGPYFVAENPRQTVARQPQTES